MIIADDDFTRADATSMSDQPKVELKDIPVDFEDIEPYPKSIGLEVKEITVDKPTVPFHAMYELGRLVQQADRVSDENRYRNDSTSELARMVREFAAGVLAAGSV